MTVDNLIDITARDLITEIGNVYYLRDRRGLRFRVKIEDAKMAWGNVRYLVAPVQGEGRSWVSQYSLTPILE